MSKIFDYFTHHQADGDIHSLMDIQDVDGPVNFENNDLMSSEFFDSVLSMERENLENGIDEKFLNDINSEATFSEGSSSHVEEALSPSGISSDYDFFNLTSNNDMSFYKNDIIDQSSVPVFRNDITEPFQNQPNVISNPVAKKTILSKSPNNQNNKKTIPKPKQQVFRIQSLSGNGRSLLLPLNVKSVKIINASDFKVANMKMTPFNNQTLIKSNNNDTEYADDEVESETNSESRYPPLNLTNEEKRLLSKEGIQLPTHYPLTKNEEKELKRIRRKIRNKISAQDSRKRKKEYVDKLEEKAKRTTEENEFLKKRIKLLRKQNGKLMEQMKKLQEVLFSNTSTKATPTTCLMIVLFSTLLVCLPNLRSSNKTEIGEQQLHAARRALLFNQQASNEDETLNMNDYLVFNNDDETELENFEDEINDIENNNTEHSFVKFLDELAKKTEHLGPETNCSGVKEGHLMEFCKKYEGDIKNVLNNMKELLEKDGNFVNEKKFIEPDISDDEDLLGMKLYDEPPSKKIKINGFDNNSKDLPIFHEYDTKIAEDVISATVETKSHERNIQQE